MTEARKESIRIPLSGVLPKERKILILPEIQKVEIMTPSPALGGGALPLSANGPKAGGPIGGSSPLSLWFAEPGNAWGAICCVLRLKHKLLLDVWILVF